MGDMGFSGGFETMATGSDAEDWMSNVRRSISLFPHAPHHVS